MKVPLLDLKAQYASLRVEIVPAVEAVLESQTFINGPQVVTDLLAALNLAAGTVVHQTRPRQRAVEFRTFLDVIDAAVPEDLDVHLVLDNSSTHKTPAIHTWLLRHPPGTPKRRTASRAAFLGHAANMQFRCLPEPK